MSEALVALAEELYGPVESLSFGRVGEEFVFRCGTSEGRGRNFKIALAQLESVMRAEVEKKRRASDRRDDQEA